jgi:hypothetical protein
MTAHVCAGGTLHELTATSGQRLLSMNCTSPVENRLRSVNFLGCLIFDISVWAAVLIA